MPQAALEKGRLERTAPLLKISQIESMQEEKRRLSETLNAPPHLRRAIHDPAQMAKTLRNLEKSLNEDSPTEYVGADQDAAVKREKELREQFISDMPTQAEMRRNPPGALDKHMQWENRHENNIGEWKNIRRRMLMSGMLPSAMSELSASNIEMFRPVGGSGELNMDNAQIPQTRTFYGLGGRSSPMTERELELLKLLAPEIYEKVTLLTADQRDEVKTAIAEHEPAIAATSVDIDAMSHKEARERCAVVGLETGGTREDLKARLKTYYGKA
jgi:hypothetical protein